MRRLCPTVFGFALCALALSLCGCGNGNGDETSTVTYDDGCSESYPNLIRGQGVLRACWNGGASLYVANISSSVVDVGFTHPGPFASTNFRPAQGNSASVVLPTKLVDASCTRTACTLRPGDGADLTNFPSVDIYVHILAAETLKADVARILGSYADKYLSNPFLAKSSVLACAEQLNGLRTPASFPEDEIRELLGAAGPCASAYKLFQESKESTVADDVLKSLEHEVKAHWVDELLRGIAKVHPR